MGIIPVLQRYARDNGRINNSQWQYCLPQWATTAKTSFVSILFHIYVLIVLYASHPFLFFFLFLLWLAGCIHEYKTICFNDIMRVMVHMKLCKYVSPFSSSRTKFVKKNNGVELPSLFISTHYSHTNSNKCSRSNIIITI